MLSAVAFSSVFEHYLGDDMKRQSPPAEDSSDEDDRKNAGNLYDKVGGHQNVCVCDVRKTLLYYMCGSFSKLDGRRGTACTLTPCH